MENWLKKVQETKLPGGAHLVPEITFGKCTPVIEGEEKHPESCLKQEKQRNFPEIYYRHVLSIMKVLTKGNAKEHVPPVRIWGAWNEPELSSLKAGQAAEVWGAAVRALHKAGCHVYCKVIAGEFAGYRKFPGRNELSYVTGYEKAIIEDARKKKWDAGKPEVWGLHDYKDLKETAETATEVSKKLVRKSGAGSAEAQAFVQGTHRAGLGRPQDWITENGVQLWVRSGHTSLYGNPEGQRIAAEDFLELGKQSTGHIETNNYYEYQTTVTTKKQEEKEGAHDDSNQFDSALLSDEGTMPNDDRPAYCVIALADKGVCPPTSTTQPAVAASITSTGATASLIVNPEGGLTKYRVEYGTTTAYGHTTTLTAAANSIGEQSEAVALSGLEACTTYHYQAEAENEADESKPAIGGDRAFTTSCGEAVAVSAGLESTCAVLRTGHVVCWGDNNYGQLGDGTSTGPEECSPETTSYHIPCSNLPVPVSGITNAVQVFAGTGNACALLAEGTVKCWGSNDWGQLGQGTTTGPEKCGVPYGGETSCSTIPIAVSGLASVAEIGDAGTEDCARLTTGTGECWGTPYEYQRLGKVKPPEAVEELGVITAINSGEGTYAPCAVRENHSVGCWDSNQLGGFGNGKDGGEYSAKPVTVGGVSNATTISAGGLSACATLSSGGIDCWGENREGAVGNGHIGEVATSAAVVGITKATQVSVGDDHACALESQEVKCWGTGGEGELGNGETPEAADEPVRVTGISSAVEISAGDLHACALLTSNQVECWGSNRRGELGDGTTTERTTPVFVAGL